MKKLSILLVFVFIQTAFAADDVDLIKAAEANAKASCGEALAAIDGTTSQRGCCSWHGGVCGCSMGSVVCCDGSFSPTCGCNRPEMPEPTKG